MLRELIQCFIHGEYGFVLFSNSHIKVLQVDALESAAMFNAMLAPRIVNEDTPHGFRSGGEEMRAVFPLLLVTACQTQPRFVNQRGGLKGLGSSFVGHSGRGESAQLLIDE